MRLGDFDWKKLSPTLTLTLNKQMFLVRVLTFETLSEWFKSILMLIAHTNDNQKSLVIRENNITVKANLFT